jgi:hypothetical protein
MPMPVTITTLLHYNRYMVGSLVQILNQMKETVSKRLSIILWEKDRYIYSNIIYELLFLDHSIG